MPLPLNTLPWSVEWMRALERTLTIIRMVNILLAALAALGASAVLLAQDEPVDFDNVVGRREVRNLGEKPAPVQPRDQDDIGRILTDRPAVPVSPARGLARPKVAKPVLPVEGTSVSSRRCKLEPEPRTGWLLVKFIDSATPLDTQRRALPCQYLEAMEGVLQKAPATTFVVSGETFVCDNRAYILLTKVLIESAGPSALPEPSNPAGGVGAASVPATRPAGATSPAPASASAPAQTRPVGRADAIVNELLGSQRRPVLLAVDQPKAAPPPSVAPAGYLELPAEESTVVADRTVRILQEPGTTWYLACFNSDNTLQEPPYRILPCELLQQAAKARQSADENLQKPGPQDMTPRLGRMPTVKEKDVAIPSTTRYRVSGEIKQYKGRKYLLMRKRLPERDMGQF